ncbi:MAG: hypothetical protein QM642_01265 [Edaphocola sp.]
MSKEQRTLNRISKKIGLLFIVFCMGLCLPPAFAQKTDNSKKAAQRPADSLKAANQRRTDSLGNLRQYRQSKHYLDSVEVARQTRIAQQKAAQQHYTDSLTAARKHVADSIMNYRTRYSDSIKKHNDSIRIAQKNLIELQKAQRKRMADSLAVAKAYRESKHYKDSVTTAREQRQKAAAAARKHVSDSVRAAQKVVRDSMMADRKHFNDSLKAALDAAKAIRTAQLDSLKIIRAARADSLTKVREARAQLRQQRAEEREKQRKDKLNLSFEMKIKKKQDAYTNEDMRKKNWSVPRQVVQNTFTRYNYFFNANKKMEEAEANMVRTKADNYDSLLSLFPFNPDADGAKLQSDMDTIIRKASLGIQIHDPRAKWQDDLYLLVGEAYYYKGDYNNAGAAFKTIISQAEIDRKEEEKKKNNGKIDPKKPTVYSEAEKTGIAGALEHKTAKNMAMLWLSRVLAQSRKEGQAQTILDMLNNDANFPERLRGSLALEQAFIDLNRQDYKKAGQSLPLVVDDKVIAKHIRLRAAYLTAQLLQQQLQYAESDKYYRRVLALNAPLEMDFYARKNIALNSIYNGTGTTSADDMLAGMTKDDKFKPYYDQVYYALGKAALKNKENSKALEYFRQSVNYSKNNPKQKGLSFAALANEYYAMGNYTAAKLDYDSAAMLLTPAQDPVYSLAKQRAQALDLVAAPARMVAVQDSLLRLSAMPEKEQRAYIKDYLQKLERRLRDSAFAANNTVDNTNALASAKPNGKDWYFSNPTLMKQGANDFKKKWGNRTLKDNWRRSNAGSGDNNNDSAAALAGNDDGGPNLPNEDTLYAAIPHTLEAIQAANDGLQHGLFALGKAYYSALEDYDKANATFDTLDKCYPQNKYAAEVLYLRYLMAMRQNQPNVAAGFNQQLQTKYPDSEWAKLLAGVSANKDIDPFAGLTNNARKESLSNYYDETYGLLVQRQYNDVLRRVNHAEEEYKDQGAFRKKFNLMKAIAIAGNGNYPEADTMLRQFVTTNPGDSLVSWANAVLEYMKRHPMQQGGTANALQPMANATHNDTLANDNGLQYAYTPNAAHFVIIAATPDAKFSGLRSGISDYNLMKQGKENISVTMATLDANKSIIICKTFNNAADAKKYLNELKGVSVLFREFKTGDYDTMLISSDNFPKLFLRKDLNAYKDFYQKNYR